jgi:hypothetical protein
MTSCGYTGRTLGLGVRGSGKWAQRERERLDSEIVPRCNCESIV